MSQHFENFSLNLLLSFRCLSVLPPLSDVLILINGFMQNSINDSQMVLFLQKIKY